MTKEELLQQLSKNEWDDFEVKEAQNDLPKSIWETVSAFSNTSGGWIILGVKEKRNNGSSQFEICGVLNPEKIEQNFIGVLRSQTKFNVHISVSAQRFIIDKKVVLAFYIPVSLNKPVFFNEYKNIFIRTGSGDQRASDFEVNTIIREQEFGIRSEREVPETSFDDINPSSLDTYRNCLRYDNPSLSYNDLSDKDFCKKIGILTKQERLTIGSLLMFGKRDSVVGICPNFWIDYIEIPGTSYNDASRRYTFRLQEQDNIWESYQLIYQRLRNHVDNPYNPQPNGVAPDDETLLYCIREGLVNLCAHSDYFSPAHPTIRVFTDRIMLQNPGRFSFDIANIENQQIASMPRNPNIIRFFRYAKLSENAGYGIDKILKWKELTGAEVNFASDLMVSTVEYHLPNKHSEQEHKQKNDPSLTQVDPSLTQVLDQIRLNNKISYAKLGQILNISPSSAKRLLQKLKDKGIIRRVGQTSSGYWEIIK